jgi:ZU5 domain
MGAYTFRRLIGLTLVGCVLGCSGDKRGAQDLRDAAPTDFEVDGSHRSDADAHLPRDASDFDANAETPTDPTDAGADAAITEEVVASGMIGASGGMVASTDGAVKLEIPAGALASDTMITIVMAAAAPNGAIGAALEIGPSGLKFDQPVLLTLRVPEGSPISGKPESTTIGTAVGDQWQPAAVVMTETSNGSVYALVNHFSIWAIIPRPVTPCLVDLECSKECCKGEHYGDELSATCWHGGIYAYDDCYAKCTGSASVRNYSTRELRGCCVGNRGYVSSSGACVLPSEAAVALTMGCSRERALSNPDDPVTICFGDSGGGDAGRTGWCEVCEACSAADCGEGEEEGSGGGDGVCVAAGNGCSQCRSCDSREECGNDADDDCDNKVDEGCSACSKSSECGQGSLCGNGYCETCEMTSCTLADCYFDDEMVQNDCMARGNGCFGCGECQSTEQCGNNVDDDCDGQVDEGCAAKVCSTSTQCPQGASCQNGYCETCELTSCTQADCYFAGEMMQSDCMARGNGCFGCGECRSAEPCGNDVDDDCDGVVDEGCTAKVCARSSQCPRGSACVRGYCEACETSCGDRDCTNAGDAPEGRCIARGNGCGSCGSCGDAEICGNDVDDDCNGQVDDGCAGRWCRSSAECDVGQRCRHDEDED